MLDESTQAMVNHIERLVAQVQDESSTGQHATPLPSNNVTILGGRGSGKSTLLAACADVLASASRIVLPTLDPELLHPGDSLMTWVLTGLDEVLAENTLDSSAGNNHSIRKMLHDLRRDHLMVSADMPKSLVERGASPAEYVRDTSELTPVGMRLSRAWRALLESIATSTGRPDLVVILPIDDIDLHPAHLARILTQLSTLRTSARFLCLMAADEANLLTNMALGDKRDARHWDTAIKYGFAERSDLGEFSARQYAKHFPRPYRIRLTDVPSDQRLEFTPAIAGGATLGELLAGFPVEYPGLTSLRDLFEVRIDGEATGAPNLHTRAISGNRRDLQQLWVALSARRAQHAPASDALVELLHHGLESCRTALPSALRDSIMIDRGTGSPRAYMNLSGLRFGTTTGRGLFLYIPEASENEEDPRSAVSIRTMTDLYTTPRSDDGEAEPATKSTRGDSAGPSTLPDMFSHLIYLMWEAKEIASSSGEPLLNLVRLTGSLATPGLRNWTRTMSSSASDKLANLMVPDWEQFSDYFSYMHVWNYLVQQLEITAVNDRRNNRRYVELAILIHLHTVVDVQVGKSVTMLPAVDRGIEMISRGGDWDAEYARLLSSLADRLVVALERPSHPSSLSRHVDFETWAGMGLIVATSRNFCSARLSNSLRALWLELDLDNDVREDASQMLGSRIPEYLREDRAAADIELLGFISPDRGRALELVREAFGERIETARRLTLSSLREASIDPLTIDRLESEGATIDTLATLGAQGVSSQDLSRVAELFPADSPEGSSKLDAIPD